jgi:hypothetical protein
MNRERSGCSLVLQDIKIRPESGHLDMPGSLLPITTEDVNDGTLGACGIFDLDDVQGMIPHIMSGSFRHC